ncbi:MAG: MG2 domain-containing protein [Defluviitaleaceae bacterium]|nr:MG2 domain-containing protein [Defluviitaleaceae bacterium]
MKKRNANYGLYILAAMIMLISARYVFVRANNHIEAMQARAEAALTESRHQLFLVTNDIYYVDSNFIATVQLSDLQGQPMSANLNVSLRQNDDVINSESFYTNDLGQAIIEFSLNDAEGGMYNLLMVVDSDLGIEHFQRDIRITSDAGQNFIINFDKGLYNPGDDVLFRILAITGATAEPLANQPFTISIFDGNDNRVYVEHVQASDFGIISGRFRLADEVNSGFYRLVVEQYGVLQAESMFEVSPFVLPRFEVILETDKSEYHVGETIYLTGRVMYFFGEPVNQGIANIYVNNNPVLTNVALDENGEFTLSYVTYDSGQYSIWVEVIDNSNFRIESTTSVWAADGVFEIDVMPEHGYLVQGMPNTVYIFTHTPSGEPVRAFLQISGRGFSRQVATDDNGIGMFILEDVEPQNDIFVRAVDMDDNMVEHEFTFEGIARNVTLSTNRPRYEMGETIYLTLNSRGRDGMFVVYAYRNANLLQIIKTEQDSVTLNLGDVFGLIDIYAVWMPAGTEMRFETLPNLAPAHRTIFIDPGNYMQLTVQSDAAEYRPGAFVHLDFDVTDRGGNPLEAALLVSIVDEAMLSLAANDLSIDNIRLALDDIRFGDDLDAATLYASLIAGASEQAITRLLLRQGDTAPRIQTTNLTNHSLDGWLDDWGHSGTDFESFFQSVLNAWSIFAIVGFSIAFFFILLRKKNEPSPPLMSSGNLPNAPSLTETSSSNTMGRNGAAWVVIISLIIFALSLMFLTSCGGNDDGDFSPAPSFDFASESAVADFAPAEIPQNVPAPVAPPSTADVFTPGIQEESAAVPDEIETQTARVRRLFLETMLFVPELIVRDGHADLSFMLADNITTWNIQVVGNTQDGLIGHTQGSIRAFQPFFVDFELPRNSIRYDQVSIPVTVFNYTEAEQTVILTIAEMDWFTLHDNAVQTLIVPSNHSQMVYVPITITQFGDFVFRAYADTYGFADAAERPIRVNPEGFRIRQVVSSGSIENSTQQHLLFMDEDIPDTRNVFITFYPSVMAQVIEGMENIFRMPFGCFEQTSSILYPNILALQYMQENGIDNPELTERALRYISSGYQRLLTFEVTRGSGGFSLFGNAPAETLLTAYGLMQLHDLTNVYTIDERVLDRMADFLFSHQNSNGTFEITGRNMNRISDSQLLAFNAYITWALSEAVPNDYRLIRSIDYLISMLDMVDDNYTLALIANALVNTGNPNGREAIDRLASNVVITGDTAYITSTTRDYFGAFGRIQYLQATALTSLALSNHGTHGDVNNLLINYIISQRDSWGTWHSTQATILSLKALTNHASQSPLEDGQITITIGDEQRIIDIRNDNTLDLYQVSFTGLERENIMDINFPNLGRMTFKVVQEFFAPYDSVQLDRGFEISSQMNTALEVHELVTQEIRIINTSGDIVKNGLVAVSIPQGFRVERSSLAMLVHNGIIERYEMRFDNINLYLRDTEPGEIIDLVIAYRPAFPVNVIGGHARVFDYYNPMIEGYLMPMRIVVA